MNGLIALAITAFTIAGCKKDTNDTDEDTSSSVDNAFAESVYDDAGTMSDEAALSGDLSSFRNGSVEGILISTCAVITRDTISSPRVVTINFGTVNCLCQDGRNRRGSIIITYTGGYRDAGSVHTIGFDNYFVNDYQVQGTKVVTNQGLNAAGHSWFTINVTGTITSPTGQVLTRQSVRQREWVSGESTPIWMDDVYHITGTATGTTFSGNTFTAVIIQPLVVALDCRWIKDGKLQFTPAGRLTRTIDYGYLNGNCDKFAQLTIGNNTHIITLR